MLAGDKRNCRVLYRRTREGEEEDTRWSEAIEGRRGRIWTGTGTLGGADFSVDAPAHTHEPRDPARYRQESDGGGMDGVQCERWNRRTTGGQHHTAHHAHELSVCLSVPTRRPQRLFTWQHFAPLAP